MLIAAQNPSSATANDSFVDSRKPPFRLIDAAACRRLIGVSSATWKRLVRRRLMPQPIKFGRASRWDEAEVVAAIQVLAELRQ